MANPIVLKTLRGKTRLLLLVLISLCINGCQSYSKPAYSGKVIDLETGDPLPNALIDVEYWKGSYGLIEQNSTTISWYKTKTDKNGYFQIPPISTSISIFSWERGVTFSVQKDGYTEIIMFNLGDCLSHGCEDKVFYYFKDKNKKIMISSHTIKLTKLE